MLQLKTLAVMPAVLAIGLAACGGTGATGGGGGAEANAGEAPAVAYVDSRSHYRIDAPGHMTANADGSASYIGPSERLQVTVVQGAQAADLQALAHADVANLPASTTDFHLLSGPVAVNLSGHQVEKFVYSWTAGTSQVTGKAVTLTGVRYYVPKDAATVAVITYAIVSNQYDPQGADDVASTFQWQ